MARSRSQHIYIFPAQHSRIASPSPATLSIEDLLLLEDKGAKVPFPGLFFYTQCMPVSNLANTCSKLGLVNGARGTAIGIYADQTGMPFHVKSFQVEITNSYNY